MAGFKVAAAQYPLDWFDAFSAYEDKMSGWVEEAAQAGAKLLVFPEYGAMELTSLAGRVARWHRVGRLQLADLLGAAKTLGEHIDECSINVVNACAQAQQLLLGCLVCIDHR